MKEKNISLIHYAVLVIITTIVGLFSFQKIMAEENSITLSERVCDFKVGTNFFGGGGIPCKGIKSSKTYNLEYIDKSGTKYGSNDVGYCYYDSSSKSYGFFYEVTSITTESNYYGKSTKKVDTIGSAFIYITNLKQVQEKGNIKIHVKNGKLAATDGCAPFVYGSNVTGRYLFSYEKLDIETVKKELDVSKAWLGSAEIDDQTKQKVKSCIETELTNGKHCNENDYVVNIVESCTDYSKVGNIGDAVRDNLRNELVNAYKEDGEDGMRVAYLRTEVCTILTNCHANVGNIKDFFNKYDKNYDPYTVKKLIEDTFPKKVQSCVEGYLGYDFNAAAADEAKRLSEEMPGAADDAERRLQDERDNAFGENGQQYYTYTGEKLIIKDGVQIGSGGDCDAMLSDETTKLFNTVLRYIQYLGPVLVVVLSTIDFIKAAASGNPDDMKKAWNKLVKRLIAAILLFFVALITRLLLSFFDITVPENCIK